MGPPASQNLVTQEDTSLMNAQPLRVAAIRFLNPAPLTWDFEHPPRAALLAGRYALHYTAPALCAEQLLNGTADLGLIPVAALTADLAIVPGCAIASLDRVRSIQLILRPGQTLKTIRTVAADTASRSSVAYAQVLLRRFAGNSPEFLPASADPLAMLALADAALLIGDPALLALEHQAELERILGPCTWIDIAHAWREHTSLPWVAAVWAVRPQTLPATGITHAQLIDDLNTSRTNGLAHIEDLVRHWTSRIALPSTTIRHYLAHNIHYGLDPACIRAVELFRRYAAEVDALPPLPHLNFLS